MHCRSENNPDMRPIKAFEPKKGAIMVSTNQYKTRGKVDSLSYFAPGFYQPNGATMNIWRDFSRRQRNGEVGTMIEMHPKDEINNLARLMETLRFCCNAHAMPNLPYLQRIDFCVDCNATDDDYIKWLKLGEWTVNCFTAKKHVKPSHAGRIECEITGEHKETYSGTNGYEFTIYNKRLQKKSAGVGYRFEIRYKRIKDKDEAESLEKMSALVKTLPSVAQEAIDIKNAKFLSQWQASAPRPNTPRDVSEFIRAHMEEIFCREQLKQLYIMLGYEESAKKRAASKAVSNFLNRNPKMLLVEEGDLTAFCECIVSHIESYIKGTTAA